jgi:hypothetical protein
MRRYSQTSPSCVSFMGGAEAVFARLCIDGFKQSPASVDSNWIHGTPA